MVMRRSKGEEGEEAYGEAMKFAWTTRLHGSVVAFVYAGFLCVARADDRRWLSW